ncbi:glycosyltransferase family 4 protein [Candidatus Parcubacteria bacterium]|nr:glycosyltransferase family 4 protein [Candidatus Parcubacteria bacterium]
MKILYISRKFPPSIGGMEKVAYELYRQLERKEEVELIKWGGSNKWLFIVVPFFLLKSFLILFTKKINIIYIADGSIAPLGFILKIFSKKPVIMTAHALDIVYSNKIYQYFVLKSIAKLDKIICISNYTKNECIKRKVPIEKITIITNGISDEFYIENMNKKNILLELEKTLKIPLEEKKIIISVGRLVKRKGVQWFVENVIPEILKKRKDFVYLVIGEGVMNEKIAKIIAEKKLNKHVKLLGKIDTTTLKFIYNSSNIFIMPNIPVKGNAEGFGLVTLEAASCGLSVVASNLEGIKDALRDYKKGFLITPYDKNEYTRIINDLLNSKKENNAIKKTREFIIMNYSWNTVSEKYLNEFTKLANK